MRTLKIAKLVLICTCALAPIPFGEHTAIAQQTTRSKVLSNQNYELWLSHLERSESVTLAEHLQSIPYYGAHASSVLSASPLNSNHASDRWKVERVPTQYDPVTGVVIASNNHLYRFRHKQSGQFLSLQNKDLTLSDRSSKNGSEHASEMQWELIQGEISDAKVQSLGHDGQITELTLPSVHIRHAASGQYIYMQNGRVNIASAPANAWILQGDVAASTNAGTNASFGNTSNTPNAVSPDLSRVWSSTYGNMHWSEGWYDETNNVLTIGAPYWSAAHNAYVLTGNWGRRNGQQNAGGIEFVFNGTCNFSGSWWYHTTPNDKKTWSGQC